MTSLWIGTHPPDGLGSPPGAGEGLWKASVRADGSLEASQASILTAPSFVARHPSLPLLYTVSEDSPSSLHVVAMEAPDAPLVSIDIGGADACHLRVAPDARAVHVALYTSGELVSFGLDSAGMPIEATKRRHAYAGSGPRADRQEASHAHFAAYAPGVRHLLVVDLGADTVWAHPLDDDQLPGPAQAGLLLPPGTGPRHLAVRGELLYVVGELDHMLHTARWDRATGTAALLAQQPATLAPHRSGEGIFDAHVELVERDSGDVLLASVRGADVISVFDIAPEGELRYRAAFDAGHWPRHFTITADAGGTGRVLVGAARGHEIRSYALADVLALEPESENGVVAKLPYASARVVSPACICPA